MIRVGLTGGIGAGKSQVLSLLRRQGVPTLSTDDLAHQCLARRDVRRILARRFGPQVLDGRGNLDRSRLADRAFSSPRDLRFLEGVLHPRIRREVERWETAQGRKARAPRLTVVEVPLLFEKGWDVFFDGVLCVSTPPSIRKQRLAVRGWDRAEIRRREGGQWPPARKDRWADWVLLNDGSVDRLAGRVRAWRLACSGKGTR